MPRLTKLDELLFPVEEHPVFVNVAGKGGERRLPVPDKKAIVNRTTFHVLGIVSRGYRLVSNREALDMAFRCCSKVFPETKPGEWEVKATDAPSTAGHCRMDLVHNSTLLDFAFVPAAERPEVFGPFIRVTNSYNGLRALAFDIGFFRKVCKNGLILPDSIIRFTFAHLHRDIGETIQFEIAHERLAKLKSSFSEYLGALRDCAVPLPLFDRLTRSVLCLQPPEPLEPKTPEADEWHTLTAHLGEMYDRYAHELGGNAYAVFNAITEFASHPLTNHYVHRDRHSLQRLAGSWVNTFSRECRKPGFQLAGYLEQLTNPEPETESE